MYMFMFHYEFSLPHITAADFLKASDHPIKNGSVLEPERLGGLELFRRERAAGRLPAALRKSRQPARTLSSKSQNSVRTE